jgi:methyltransferase
MSGLGWPEALAAFVLLQRLGELALAKRNTARLLREPGAYEAGAGHYPMMVALHAAWLAAVAWAAWQADGVVWGWAALFLALQAGRLWVLASLGRYWTTRIIVVPGAPLVRRGPYRWLKHPNYIVVAGEIAALPLALGAWEIAAAFTLLNAAMLTVRIRAEAAANQGRETATARPG